MLCQSSAGNSSSALPHREAMHAQWQQPTSTITLAQSYLYCRTSGSCWAKLLTVLLKVVLAWKTQKHSGSGVSGWSEGPASPHSQQPFIPSKTHTFKGIQPQHANACCAARCRPKGATRGRGCCKASREVIHAVGVSSNKVCLLAVTATAEQLQRCVMVESTLLA